MTSITILSDTHLPKRARALPTVLWSAIDRSDLVVHAGDWVHAPLLDELERRASRLVAVWGNNDPNELRARLPEIARFELGGLRWAVTHETGPAGGRERRMDGAFPRGGSPETASPGTDVLIFGHSHIPWDSVSPGGLRLLNPGSPTDRRRQPHGTFMTATVDAGVLSDVVVHEIPSAGQSQAGHASVVV